MLNCVGDTYETKIKSKFKFLVTLKKHLEAMKDIVRPSQANARSKRAEIAISQLTVSTTGMNCYKTLTTDNKSNFKQGHRSREPAMKYSRGNRVKRDYTSKGPKRWQTKSTKSTHTPTWANGLINGMKLLLKWFTISARQQIQIMYLYQQQRDLWASADQKKRDVTLLFMVVTWNNSSVT